MTILNFKKFFNPDKSAMSSLANYSETKACYLDGRYFNLMFENYPGLIREPLIIQIQKSENNGQMEETSQVYMRADEVDTTVPGLLRVIIDTPNSRHSNLLIIDYENHVIHRLEPMGKQGPYFNDVNNIILQYLSVFMPGTQLNVIDIELDMLNNPMCDISGYCMACVIMYADWFVNDRDFEPQYLKQYASMIEETFGQLPERGADVEMGYYDGYRGGPYRPNVGGALLGGLAGGVLGGVALGGAGALLGGLGGAAIGSTL